MSVPVIVPKDGAFEIHDWAFSADAVAEVAACYIEARDEAESDFDQRRLDHHARWSEPAQQAAADDLREACALRFDSVEDLEAFGCRVAVAVELARQATAVETVARTHVLGHQFSHPGMGNGSGCAVMIDEGIVCGESRDHRIHCAAEAEVAS